MRLLLLDSASLYWRAFHALPDSIVDAQGHPVNAVRGYLDTVARLIEARVPDRVVAAWDQDWRPQWRVDLVPTYKAHRAEDGAAGDEEQVPDLLGPQIPVIAELSEMLGVDVIGAPECEADDVIASLALRHRGKGDTVDIASGDRDLVQLVDDRTTLLYTGGTAKSRGGLPWLTLDEAGVRERFSVAPDVYALMAVLRGDPSDGLPGVRGIGAKTAIALVGAYPGIPALLEAAAKQPDPPMTARLAASILQSAQAIENGYAITALTDRPEVGALPDRTAIDAERALARGADLGLQRSVHRVLDAWGAAGAPGTRPG